MIYAVVFFIFVRIMFRHLEIKRTDKMIMDLENFVKYTLGKFSIKKPHPKKKKKIEKD